MRCHFDVIIQVLKSHLVIRTHFIVGGECNVLEVIKVFEACFKTFDFKLKFDKIHGIRAKHFDEPAFEIFKSGFKI